jgi:hypothetical protein
MKNILFNMALLTVLISNCAYASTYGLNNNNISISFDDETSIFIVKDELSNHKMVPEELFFLTLPNEDKIHSKDFKVAKVEKIENSIHINYINKDF